MGDYFSLIFDSMNKVLTQQGSFFEGAGMNLFQSFALILVTWFGIQSALSSAEGGAGFSWVRFVALLQELMLVYIMLAFYTVPIPGLGISFTHLILDQASAMIAQLNQSRIQDLIQTLDAVETNLPYPGPLEILAIIRFFILLLCILAAEAVTLYVIMYGYVATAVLVLLGPIFIPFKVVPQMEWLFWGWFRAFIQYAFYQVVASAYVFIFGDFLMQFFGGSASPLSSEEIAVLFVPMVLTLVTFTLGTLKIPTLTVALFSGRAGDYIFPKWS
jgi:hypothetical protein